MLHSKEHNNILYNNKRVSKRVSHICYIAAKDLVHLDNILFQISLRRLTN